MNSVIYKDFKNKIHYIKECSTDDDYNYISKLADNINDSVLLTINEKCELLGLLAEKKTKLTPNDTMSISDMCDYMVNEGDWEYED